ncbi:heparan sulfate sulfotransferase [Aureococcus anophagefferens]|uniref:Heparan sulfate sulfotransferase n=1 Tax=Aureococcus anophagefferens TaxID=44056 RepID=A0ABR1FNK8_AURAN
MTARRDATAPRDTPAPAAPAPTRFPRLSRITNSMGCVRLICVLETLIVALCLLEAHTRCGERSLGCCVSSKCSNFFDVRWDDDRHAALGDDEARCRAYESLFSKLTARRGAYDVAVDATATYFRDPRAAPRVRRCFDDGALARTTLLAVLRDPAARLYSEYAVIRSRQPDRFGNATFARAVDGWLSDRGDAEGRRLLAVGHYVDQLLAWHRHLPREALYVVPAAALDDDATPRALHAVNVEVRRSLSVPPAAASAAWLDYTWSGGGGLPGLLLREPSDAAVPRERLILPLGLRETLDEAAGTTLRYRVTGAGLARDVVDGSHRGVVAFEETDDGCEMVWTADYEVSARRTFWQKATEVLVGAAGDNLQRYVAAPSRPRWFDPLDEFGLGSSVDRSKPLLLVLPGLDGSAVTAWTQYPELATGYEVRALAVPPNARVDFDGLVAAVVAAAEGADRDVYVLGESIGAGVALAAGKQSKAVDGLVLVSPATSWADTPLGGAREAPLNAPDLVLMAVVAISAYQLLDSDQLATTVRRVARELPAATSASWRSAGAAVRATPRSGRRRAASAATAAPSANDPSKNRGNPSRSLGGAAVRRPRWRLTAWIEPAYAAAATDALATIACPVLCVAGSADLRVPAEAEAARIAAVQRRGLRRPGAGHAGATDDRVDLAALLADWRAGRVASPEDGARLRAGRRRRGCQRRRGHGGLALGGGELWAKRVHLLEGDGAVDRRS